VISFSAAPKNVGVITEEDCQLGPGDVVLRFVGSVRVAAGDPVITQPADEGLGPMAVRIREATGGS
jgi:hypothetical protein